MGKKYEVLHEGSSPIVRYCLNKGEFLKAESDAMIAMSATIDVEAKAEGGILKGLARKMAGESFFFQYLTATRGAGEVLFGHSFPGDISPVEFDGSTSLLVQKNGFLAATEGIKVDTKIQGLSKALFSGEGFFILKISGTGTVFLSSYGAIHTVSLGPGEEFIVDNGHLVAWPEVMDFKIQKASKGIMSSLKSGEGLVCRFTGPGQIILQTRNLKGLLALLASQGLKV